MNFIKNTHLILLFSFGLYSVQNTAQNTNKIKDNKQKVSLEDIIAIASKSSLDAFKAKQQYGASYWQFRSFKASVLPKVGLELEPLTYNKSVLKRYDSENNIDVYRPQQNLNSYGNLSINQNIKATGATLYAISYAIASVAAMSI